MTTPTRVDAREFRRVFGHFCTGVTIITTAGPAGFACQAFVPLSLDPPMVLFCPQATSRTWQRIRETGVFCVNVLAAGDHELSRAFGASHPDKFAGVAWSPSPLGAPILHGALTWAECAVAAVHPGGDHAIVTGEVQTLGECRDGDPLLFFKGRYRSAAPPPPSATTEVVDTLLAWPRHTDWI
ncbi:3-hydroxy-9,10-secoandrosta-1,3,5(10)-triene-9,17-dione monooxygenase reductase subunit [Actinoplanes sp. L3-i22]|uniref:3-hydroxy-9,10-secoandrosta-1,3,5(10)-triene-9, 17-dione monooxygenase reductase subunit n=1 Tax=Actinoplanes sp. L3-i22 TaxID=2836373 RepID=UPI001C772521|nr:3-hydroxy-9,10-secoandrosta-1,3,5(10)-triene-9,17-dione monooxygenase reductase subunit [Actinoplanes sp. L3-i22]BCY13356.1 monooxygenase [Actinoplanes sp. L3-i22]